MRSKCILQSIDESANRMSHHGYQPSQMSIPMKADEIKDQMEDMLTAERASEFLEKYDSRGSIKKSGKSRGRCVDGTISSASNAQINRKIGMTKKKVLKASASPLSRELSASRSNLSTNKTATAKTNTFHQSASVNALDSALKKQIVDKMAVARATNHSRPQAAIELKVSKVKPPARNGSKLKDLR